MPLLGSAGPQSRIFGGVDYLYVRPNFSEALAYVDIGFVPPGRTYRQLDFDYESSYRWYTGVRDVCCGFDVTFSGANVGGDASVNQVIAVGTNAFQTPFPTLDGTTFTNGGIGGGAQPGQPFAAGNPFLGTNFTISSNVDLDYWDLRFSKTIPLGSAVGCCGACDDPCGCDCGPCCPAWDITWSGGVRIADGGWSRNATAITPAGLPDVTVAETLDFSGAGLIASLEGRRYFGQTGSLSIFLNSDVGLLLGDASYNRTSVTGAGPAVTDQATFTRVIPVIDLQVGGSLYVTRNFSLSAGYLFQAWQDLGMSPERTDLAIGTVSFDDANILGFDGFFARSEFRF